MEYLKADYNQCLERVSESLDSDMVITAAAGGALLGGSVGGPGTAFIGAVLGGYIGDQERLEREEVSETYL